MKHILRALTFYRREGPRMAGVFLLLLLNVAASLLKPWPLALIVDSVLGVTPLPGWLQNWTGVSDKNGLLFILGLSVLAIHAGQGVIAAAQNFLAIRVGLNGLRRVRLEVFTSLQRLSLRFQHGAKSGDLIHRAAWDTYSFQTLFQQGLVTAVAALVSLLLMTVVMARLNIFLTGVALALVPALWLVIHRFGRRMTERGMEAQQADSQLTAQVQQSIVTLPLIQSYTREEHEARAFSDRAGFALEKRLSQHGWELVYWLLITVIFAAGTAAIVWLGGREVLAGKLRVGELLIFLAYLTQFYEPLNQLSHVGATIAGATAGTQRVFELLDTPEEVQDSPDAQPLARARGTIEFDHVSFAYVPGQPVLVDVSFQIPAGQSVAIIGPSGVGKTTLLNLLPRFFDPTAGAVKLDGQDLRQLRRRDVRANVSVVLQEPILLPGTIADNIACGKPDATRAEIENAARAAYAHLFIEKLPAHYDTVVGDGGAHLSVGERQRLNLARAFLKNAPVLLLDEPTSALDAESEAHVVAGLFNLIQGRTTLIVAHRLTTIAKVDTILVLHEGRLIEQGTRDELMARDGYFARVAAGRIELE
jgi:ATP-binding cassette subfamily B protein/subfamily B ATP-binding cassette protein MsbA